MVCVAILCYACGTNVKLENTTIGRKNLLHDIAPFTPDSLVNVVIEIPAGTNQKWEINKLTRQIEWERVARDSFRVIDIIKLWLLHYKGTGKVKILSVNDEHDAIRFLKSAHFNYIEQKTK